jgi:hypothetical protein
MKDKFFIGTTILIYLYSETDAEYGVWGLCPTKSNGTGESQAPHSILLPR